MNQLDFKARRINVLADKTLLAAYSDQTHNLELRHLNAAANDTEMTRAPLPALRKLHRWGWRIAGLTVSAALLIFCLFAVQRSLSPDPHAQRGRAACLRCDQPSSGDAGCNRPS